MGPDIKKLIPGNCIRSWEQLAALVEYFSYWNQIDWLFRGVRDASYALIPRIGRSETRAKKTDVVTAKRSRVPYRPDDELGLLEIFKDQARAYLPNPPSLDLEWLALAQHYGMPTRLLDWTESVLVAAWFAVEDPKKDRDSAIWVTRNVPPVNEEDRRQPFSAKQVKIYRPPHISPRISAQQSVFTLQPKPIKEVTLPFAEKYTVGWQNCFTIKKRLHACGVNRRSLFIDLSGLCEHLSWIYKHDWLPLGYRTGSFNKTADPSSLRTAAYEISGDTIEGDE